jgi:hypothetical protein
MAVGCGESTDADQAAHSEPVHAAAVPASLEKPMRAPKEDERSSSAAVPPFLGEWEGRWYASDEYFEAMLEFRPDTSREALQAEFRRMGDRENYWLSLDADGTGRAIHYAMTGEPTDCTWELDPDAQLLTIRYLLPRKPRFETIEDRRYEMELQVVDGGATLLKPWNSDFGESGERFTRPGVYQEAEKPPVPAVFDVAAGAQASDFVGAWTGFYLEDDVYESHGEAIALGDARAVIPTLDEYDVYAVELREDSSIRIAGGEDNGIWTVRDDGVAIELRFHGQDRRATPDAPANVVLELNADKTMLMERDVYADELPVFLYLRD